MQTSKVVELVTKEDEGDHIYQRSSTSMDDKHLNLANQEAKGKHILINVEDEDIISRITENTSIIHMAFTAADNFVNCVPHSSPSIKIDEVPKKRHKLNEDAYSPRVVSIGPFHYNRLHLEFLGYKNRCLHRYLKDLNINENDIARIAVKHESSIKSGYGSSLDLKISRQDFLEMIMKDSIFMIELFLDQDFSNLFMGPIFTDPWRNHDILHDMMLFENQIPCELLKELFSKRPHSPGTPLYKYIHKYFKDVGNMDNLPPIDYLFTNLLDFLRKYHCPTDDNDDVALISKRIGKIVHTNNAKELQEAGIVFRKETTTTKQLLDIKFSAADGILTIPQLIVNEWSEIFYLNLIAFEQRNPRVTHQYISSYFILMENLAKTPKDVDLLVGHGIIKNSLGDNEQVRSLLTNLSKSILIVGSEFYFAGLCHDLNKYSKDWWHQWKGAWYGWKRMLRRDYFSNPWSIISVVAAIILLSLTVIQTVCSVISVK